MISLIAFIKREAVLCAALLLAVISAFFVTPSAAYASYIDFHTLMLLFSLMCVMADYQGMGLFRTIGQALLGITGSTRGIILVLVFLPFFLSMIITNDVALITFVPFALTVLKMSHRETLIVPVVGLQTIAANLGSMLLPMGNPQNLYLYAKSGISLGEFVMIMIPYTVISGILLLGCCLVAGRKKLSDAVNSGSESPSRVGSAQGITGVSLLMATVLFFMAFCTIMKWCPVWLLALCVLLYYLIADRKVLARVDYSLLLTFIGFFIFIGNMKQLPAFSTFFQGIVGGHETPVAIAASQIISNVPAALLLSGFTENYRSLVIGTNLGGLGTLIASMASLISFKQIARECPESKGRYFIWFTVSNIAFLVVLGAAWFFIR
ncbi:MAG: citrate transporter [Treponemataceae bacterium]|nr:citrate transporter [Treponemataceae bacterium]